MIAQRTSGDRERRESPFDKAPSIRVPSRIDGFSARVKQIDIILPVYNEEAAIRLFNDALEQALQALSDRYRFQLIYVVDRSSDASFEILSELARRYGNIKVIHMSRRFGHQMSLVAGLDTSTGDAVIMMDSDLQHPPALIETLIGEFEKGHDIVHTMRAYDESASLMKKATSHLFYWIQNQLSPVELRPGVADFRLVSRKVVRVFKEQLREHNQFLRGLFQWIGFSTTVVPFQCQPRAGGRTKYTLSRLLAFFSDGIISFSRVPLRAAIVFGFTIWLSSMFYASYLVVMYFVSGNFPRGYTSLLLAILFIGGLQLTVLGVIGEYVGHVFDEVKARPLYVVDETAEGALTANLPRFGAVS
jgi:dolichol-phosphate mannosyltransferase